MSSRTHPRSPGSRWGTVTWVAAALIVALLGWGLFSVWSNLLGMSLCNALVEEDTPKAKWAITWGANLNYDEGRYSPPLVLAVRYRSEVVPLLLRSSRTHLQAQDGDGWTALREALMGLDADVVQQIIDAEVRLRQEPTGQEERLLRAALRGRADLVDAVLDRGVAPDATAPGGPPGGPTPLLGAALMGRADVVGLLTARGADVNRTCFELYATPRHPLEVAALAGMPTFQALLEGGGERLTSKSLSAYLSTVMLYNPEGAEVLLQPPYERKLSTAALRDSLSYARESKHSGFIGRISALLRRRGVVVKPEGAQGKTKSRQQ